MLKIEQTRQFKRDYKREKRGRHRPTLEAENRQITIAEMAKTIRETDRSIERNIEILKAQSKL